MKITDWKCIRKGHHTEVSADIDGFRLWYRVPEPYLVSQAGDPFLAVALLPAMRQGEAIEIDPSLPVSPILLANISTLQEIHHCWNPKQLMIVPVVASTAPAAPLNAGAMSFFSGGVDSMYTFLKHRNEITHVVNIHGFDFYFNSEAENALTFSAADIKDLGRLAWQLNLPRGPLSAWIKTALSASARGILSNYRETGKEPGTTETALVEDLNKIISAGPIFDAKRFAGVNLRPRTRDLLAQNPQGDDLIRLNRLLLEDAYSREISGKYGGETYQIAIDRNARFVEGFGKTLITIETNHYAFGYRYNLSRNLSHGSALGSVANLLGFSRTFVPSSRPYANLYPLGSHPLSDPLWSNECVQIIHDGCEAGRADKTRMICECQPALENLRVCFEDVNNNCGKCEKCLRTMLSIHICHSVSGPFPPLPSLKVLRKLSIGGGIERLFYYSEIYDLAMQMDNKELANALRIAMRRHERKWLMQEIDRVLLGGLLKRAYRKYVVAPGISRIDSTPQNE